MLSVAVDAPVFYKPGLDGWTPRVERLFARPLSAIRAASVSSRRGPPEARRTGRRSRARRPARAASFQPARSPLSSEPIGQQQPGQPVAAVLPGGRRRLREIDRRLEHEMRDRAGDDVVRLARAAPPRPRVSRPPSGRPRPSDELGRHACAFRRPSGTAARASRACRRRSASARRVRPASRRRGGRASTSYCPPSTYCAIVRRQLGGRLRTEGSRPGGLGVAPVAQRLLVAVQRRRRGGS